MSIPRDPRQADSGSNAAARTGSAVEVFRADSEHERRERELVLRAIGIAYVRADEPAGRALYVQPADAERALTELATYERENRDWPPREKLDPPAIGVVAGLVGYALVLGGSYVATTVGPGSARAFAAGRAHAGAILDGAWWRTFTALTLHTGPPHLLSNLFFGGLFAALVLVSVGGGFGVLGILLAGALGNFLNALLQSPEHLSVGASTAVFGAVGMLVGAEWRRRFLLRVRKLRRAAPIVMGMLLLAYHGLGSGQPDDRTDVLAHVTGLVCGLPLGALWIGLPKRLRYDRGAQLAAGALALALLAGAWVLALI